MDRLEIPVRTGRVTIDLEGCKGCTTLACVKACALFGTGLFRVEHGRPALVFDKDEAKRRCNECLGCERFCQACGQGALHIELDMFGLQAREEESGGNPG
jgi:dissimilatory sulfite reductase (desulfoviridin) alpha/beta subunit